MRKIVVVENVTLDGVMQGPGRADEDTRGGFGHGGWATSYHDEVMGAEMGRGMGRTDLLFGRRTYQDFAAVWPNQPEPNPFTKVLNDTLKCVASRTLPESLPWVNSVLLAGDAATTVAELKRRPGNDITVLGSGELVRSLMRNGLVDEYVLLIHPLVLGTGRRLFPDDGPSAAMRLVRSVPTGTGVIIATYRPIGAADPGTRG